MVLSYGIYKYNIDKTVGFPRINDIEKQGEKQGEKENKRILKKFEKSA